MSHTPEHWAVYRDGKREMNNVSYFIKSLAGDLVTYGHLSEENARRIVACVNACAGIPNDQLECDEPTFVRIFNERNTLNKQRDELLAILEGIESVTPNHMAKRINDAIASVRKSKGQCYYAPDGTLMNADGTRSIFDDVDL